MYEINAKWREYYQESEPKVRQRVRDQLFMLEPDDGANEYRMMLYDKRYKDPKNPSREVDKFLWNFVNFIELYKSSKIFKKSAAKEVKKSLQEMLFDICPEFGAAGETALYWEIRNAADRYFQTCGLAGYRRKLFGLMGSSSEEKLRQMTKDVWQMTIGLSKQIHMEEEMRIWNAAVIDAYSCTGADAAKRLEAYDQEK